MADKKVVTIRKRVFLGEVNLDEYLQKQVNILLEKYK